MDDSDYERASKVFGPDMRVAEKIAALWNPNPEVMFHIPEQPKPVASVIDLRRKYEINTTHCGRNIYRSIDLVTFDPDPESTMHVQGWGNSPAEAQTDLLEQLAAIVAETQP
jgi:hypothetical protein